MFAILGCQIGTSSFVDIQGPTCGQSLYIDSLLDENKSIKRVGGSSIIDLEDGIPSEKRPKGRTKSKLDAKRDASQSHCKIH